MKHILVPTDFSLFSMNAVKCAADIARKSDAELHLLHVVNIPSHEVGILPFQDAQNVAEGLFILNFIMEKFAALKRQKFLKGLTVHEILKFDDIFTAAQKCGSEIGVGLIVMGTHGTSGIINQFFVGSNTDKMVRRSKIPVLTVRGEVSISDVKNIIFAADFDAGIPEAFTKIRTIVEALSAKLHLVRIVTRDDFYFSKPMLEIMDQFAKDQRIENYECHVFTAENVQEGINEFAEHIHADLIATVTHGRRGLARLLNGSITENLSIKSSIPVLTSKIE